jgi:hypothetical protein
MALPTHLTLEIVTPERPLVKETVDEVTLPGVLGELGILPGHTPLLTVLKVGVLSYRKGDERSYVAIVHGFAEALADRARTDGRAGGGNRRDQGQGGPGTGGTAPRRRRPPHGP